jgi:hypothetical protein
MTAQAIGALASTIVNRWAWWQQALKGNFGPMHEGEPQQGFYRTRFKGGKWEPVAIWWDEDTGWVAYRNGRDVDPGEAWNFCRTHPITREAYDRAMVGQPFDDEDATVAAQVAAGHNSGDLDIADELKDQIESALAGLKAYETVGDDATAAKALSLRNRLNELSNKADKVRTEQKAPHLAAGKAVDEKWQPLVKKAKAGADTVRDAIGAFETRKLQEQRKREREAEQARLAAEQAAREQQSETAAVEAPAPAPAPAAAPAPIKAAYGKAASVKVSNVVKDVTDWPALAVYMSNHPDCQDLLRKLAQRALDAGRTNIPGITTQEKAAVR